LVLIFLKDLLTSP